MTKFRHRGGRVLPGDHDAGADQPRPRDSAAG
jgi:hypothetical protein